MIIVSIIGFISGAFSAAFVYACCAVAKEADEVLENIEGS